MQIKTTNNYEIFKIIKENREINYNKVMNLKSRLIEDKRQIIPIICNSNMEIIDGQHRFQALKELEWEVMYYIDDKVKTKDLITINNTQKKWSLNDYIHFYASSGNSYYEKIEILIKKYYDLPLRAIMCAIGNGVYKHERYLKSGQIEFTEFEFIEAENCLSLLQGIKRALKGRNINNPAILFFLVAKIYFLEGIDRERLSNSIIERYGTENYGNSVQCAMVLEHWYNHKLRTYRYISNEILPKR